MNANRLKSNSPCGKTGKCNEAKCNTPNRLCNIITIIERKPNDTDITVILVGEKLVY